MNKISEELKTEIFEYWKSTGSTFPQIKKIYGISITAISSIISKGMGWTKPKLKKEKVVKVKEEIIEEEIPISIYSKIGGRTRNRTYNKLELGLASAPSVHTLKKAVYSSKQGRKK